MLIPDNLRQEHMPMMVYALCRIVKNNSYTEDDVIKLLSVTWNVRDEKSSNQVGNVLNFSIKAGIVIVKDSILYTEFLEEELISAKAFSTALLKKIDLLKSEKFSSVLKWFLWKGAAVEVIERHKDVNKEMLEDSLLKQLNISEDYTHGFLFWIEFLGMATHSVQPMGGYNYSIENILIDYIRKNDNELKKHGNMPMKEFFDTIAKDLFFIPICYTHTEICYSLSFALRVLERMGVIDIEDKNDGSMTWHLEKSSTFKKGNSFTNIKVN